LTDHREKHEDWMQMPRRVRFVFHLRTVEFSLALISFFAPSVVLPLSDWTSSQYHPNEFGNIFLFFCFLVGDYYFQVRVSWGPAGKPCRPSARWVTIHRVYK
jgi:hypothetical protein